MGQQDLHEFLGQFLKWTKPSCVNGSWKQVAQEGDLILIKDQGDPHNPPPVSAPDHTEKIEPA